MIASKPLIYPHQITLKSRRHKNVKLKWLSRPLTSEGDRGGGCVGANPNELGHKTADDFVGQRLPSGLVPGLHKHAQKVVPFRSGNIL
jgi:hypothetical protein